MCFLFKTRSRGEKIVEGLANDNLFHAVIHPFPIVRHVYFYTQYTVLNGFHKTRIPMRFVKVCLISYESKFIDSLIDLCTFPNNKSSASCTFFVVLLVPGTQMRKFNEKNVEKRHREEFVELQKRFSSQKCYTASDLFTSPWKPLNSH